MKEEKRQQHSENTLQLGNLLLQSRDISLNKLIDLAKKILKDETFRDFLRLYKFKEQSGTVGCYG